MLFARFVIDKRELLERKTIGHAAKNFLNHEPLVHNLLRASKRKCVDV